MPEKSQVINAQGYDATKLLAIAYGTCEKLGWNIKYAVDNIIVAYTPRKAFRWDMEMTFQATENQLTVTSKMIHNEVNDMMGRNKKNIDQFVSAFEEVKQKTDEQSLRGWNEKINALTNDTLKAAESEIKEAAEIDKVMNFSTGNMYFTYGIIAINVLVFVLMLLSGVHIMQPLTADIVKWGGNQYDLTLNGEWWRLLTSMFEHIGIFHLLLNMYALYSLAVYLEPMLGKLRFTAGYLSTGIFAGLASLWWHSGSNTVSAGASGAIFGMYGIMLALLLTNLIPKQVRQALLQSILLFVAYNIFYGLRPGSGIDNSAHIGGFISGLAVGILFYFSLGKNETKNKANLFASVALIAAILAAYTVIDKHEENDNGKFYKAQVEFSQIEDKALEVYRDDKLTDKQKEEMLRNISLVEWKKGEALFNSISEDKLTGEKRKEYSLLKEYCRLRREYVELQLKSISGQEVNFAELNNINNRVAEIIKELNPEGK
jgi:rhomboid protease GluP